MGVFFSFWLSTMKTRNTIMQVMDNDQFNQNEILIGGSGKTISAKVSDDPILMSMLSTGFYANPHRAMIQETMFNAWDAHRKGNCQDKPIDIYINAYSGFTVRDYGPGISDDKMESVYFTYAASTKRDDADMTGGFGLGSKSPWAYTESFTVTSHHNGMKFMYLMSRVSDEVGGKPGMTPLMSSKSDETGMVVSVPLEDNNHSLGSTYKTVLDVLYLSGIKARIHFKDESPKIINSTELAPNQYTLDTRTSYTRGKVYAVYGGVRYEIISKDEYAEEFKFVSLISEIKSLFIGFAPHSLTPLPNREGLNMSTSTKENIKVALELCMESFKSVFKSLMPIFFYERMNYYKEQEVEPHFALFHAITKSNISNFFVKNFEEKMKPLVPDNVDKTSWEIALHILVKSPKSVIRILGKKYWIGSLINQFIKTYPEAKQLGFNIIKEPVDKLISEPGFNTYSIQKIITNWVMPNQMSRLFEFEEQLTKKYSEDKTFVRPKIRLKNNYNWITMERHRNAPKKIARRFMKQSNRPIDTKVSKAEVKFLDPTQIWASKDGTLVHQFFMSNTVILAKTVTALKDTNIPIEDYFSKNNLYSKNYLFNSDYGIIPAYVVHSKKGWYDTALEILTNLGFKVIEADAPALKIKDKSNKTQTIHNQYSRIDINNANWKASKTVTGHKYYDVKEDDVPLIDPKYFLYIKSSKLKSYTYYKSMEPTTALVNCMIKLEPDIAMVNNKAQANKLTKLGVKPFHEFVIDWKKSLNTNVYYLRNIVRVIKVLNTSSIPLSLIKNPQIQIAMGITKIKVNNSSFWEEVQIINVICKERYSPLIKTTSELKMLVNTTWDNDPKKEKIEKCINTTRMLSKDKLEIEMNNLKETEQKNLISKLARFIKTV